MSRRTTAVKTTRAAAATGPTPSAAANTSTPSIDSFTLPQLTSFLHTHDAFPETELPHDRTAKRLMLLEIAKTVAAQQEEEADSKPSKVAAVKPRTPRASTKATTTPATARQPTAASEGEEQKQQWGSGWDRQTTEKASPRRKTTSNNTEAPPVVESGSDAEEDDEDNVFTKQAHVRKSLTNQQQQPVATHKRKSIPAAAAAVTASPKRPRASTANTSAANRRQSKGGWVDNSLLSGEPAAEDDAMDVDEEQEPAFTTHNAIDDEKRSSEVDSDSSDDVEFVERRQSVPKQPNDFQRSSLSPKRAQQLTSQAQTSQRTRSPLESTTRTVPTLHPRFTTTNLSATQPLQRSTFTSTTTTTRRNNAARPVHVRTKSRLAEELQQGDDYFEKLISQRIPTITKPFTGLSVGESSAPHKQADINRLSLTDKQQTPAASSRSKQPLTPLSDLPRPRDVDVNEPVAQRKRISLDTLYTPRLGRRLLQAALAMLVLSLLSGASLFVYQNPTTLSLWPLSIIEPVFRPFCSSETSDKQRLGLLSQQCLSCPSHGHCTASGYLICDPLYVRSGDSCVESPKLRNRVLYFRDLAIDILQQHAGLYECGHLTPDSTTTTMHANKDHGEVPVKVTVDASKSMTEVELHHAIQQRDKDIDSIDSLLWHKTKDALKSDEAAQKSILVDNDHYEALHAAYPLACRLRKAAWRHKLPLLTLTSILSAISYAVYSVRRWLWRRSTAKQLTQQVTQYLQDDTSNAHAIDHVRRDLDWVGKDDTVWKHVVDTIDNDTRVEHKKSTFGHVKRDSWQWVSRISRKNSNKRLSAPGYNTGDSDVVMRHEPEDVDMIADVTYTPAYGQSALELTAPVIPVDARQTARSQRTCIIC